MKNLSSDTIIRNESGLNVDDHSFFEKIAAKGATTAPETNENDSDPGEMMDEDHEPETEQTSEARWGQEAGPKASKGPQPVVRNSSAVKVEVIKNREGALSDLFKHKSKVREQETLSATLAERVRKLMDD